MAHLSIPVNMSFIWYLDSGCSSHMIEKNEYLTDYIKSHTRSVTCGDGVKNKVIGVGTLMWKEYLN